MALTSSVPLATHEEHGKWVCCGEHLPVSGRFMQRGWHAQELSQQPAIDGFKAGMALGDQMRALAEEELVLLGP